jgi:serine/threonine protein kinase
MEYCPGGDLSSFIKSRQTIQAKYTRRFLQQIGTSVVWFDFFFLLELILSFVINKQKACALKHLHSIGIAHMDLKVIYKHTVQAPYSSKF